MVHPSSRRTIMCVGGARGPPPRVETAPCSMCADMCAIMMATSSLPEMITIAEESTATTGTGTRPGFHTCSSLVSTKPNTKPNTCAGCSRFRTYLHPYRLHNSVLCSRRSVEPTNDGIRKCKGTSRILTGKKKSSNISDSKMPRGSKEFSCSPPPVSLSLTPYPLSHPTPSLFTSLLSSLSQQQAIFVKIVRQLKCICYCQFLYNNTFKTVAS